MSWAVVGLVTVAKLGRAAGYGLVGASLKLDRWAESWLVSHVRRENDALFGAAIEAVPRQEPLP